MNSKLNQQLLLETGIYIINIILYLSLLTNLMHPC